MYRMYKLGGERHSGVVVEEGEGYHTKLEKPGSGALLRAMLFMMICPPLRLTTALPSGSESV